MYFTIMPQSILKNLSKTNHPITLTKQKFAQTTTNATQPKLYTNQIYKYTLCDIFNNRWKQLFQNYCQTEICINNK